MVQKIIYIILLSTRQPLSYQHLQTCFSLIEDVLNLAGFAKTNYLP